MNTAAPATEHPQYGAKRKIRQQKLDPDLNPTDNRLLLRIKLRSLMMEARIIRQAERRSRSLSQFAQLHQHRVTVVRNQSRTTGLALAFIRGKKHADVEKAGSKPLDYSNLRALSAMIWKYGNIRNTPAEIESWLNA